MFVTESLYVSMLKLNWKRKRQGRKIKLSIKHILKEAELILPFLLQS